MPNTFPGNSAWVLPPLKGSPWFRVCSTTCPAGTLKQKLKHSKIELTPNHKVPSHEIIITKFVFLIIWMSTLVLVGPLSWWPQCIGSCSTKSGMKLQLKLRTVCVVAVWLDTSVNHTVKLMTHTCHVESILFFITKVIYPTHYRKQFSTVTQIIMWISRIHACCFWLLGKGCTPVSQRRSVGGGIHLAKLAPRKVMFSPNMAFYI